MQPTAPPPSLTSPTHGRSVLPERLYLAKLYPLSPWSEAGYWTDEKGQQVSPIFTTYADAAIWRLKAFDTQHTNTMHLDEMTTPSPETPRIQVQIQECQPELWLISIYHGQKPVFLPNRTAKSFAEAALIANQAVADHQAGIVHLL